MAEGETASLSPSETDAVASYSSVLSQLAEASKSAALAIEDIQGSDEEARPASYKIIGIVLAIVS